MAKSGKKKKGSSAARKKAPAKAPRVRKAAKPASRPKARKPVVKARKTPVKPSLPVSRPAPMPIRKAVPVVRRAAKPARKLPVAELKEYRQSLKNLRDRVVDEIAFLAGDNLNRSQRESSGDLSSYSFHMADQGTDNFDREFALNLVSSEQDALYEIDEALQRVDAGTYGACESCGGAIEKARLKAMPFARMCIHCKSESEKGRSKFRPFGPTIQQSSES